ncbi:Yip1 domain-containing protein [Heterostelium album PN500]|uniref:Protein YIPF n=1 Tax=Heterostelium pallidum (strain ATCC 26659 / Pp 5 / PN500) TaxID=670386 RepID=D3BN10_HETP5|nr:Yip1 domain-containing protein [Heterostelium album PN500]EFA77372.1 Yip1 domain-containing protein [Heterostelium album PN500]|eukprot:XP_020429501.1 Yip1 domain-containing protein [Heterostelium album PN500]
MDQQHQQMSMNTLDEPVYVTILRDIKTVGFKLYHVIIPRGNAIAVLRDWDLWGPLLLCLLMAIMLSTSAPDNQKALVFALVFVVVWVGAGLVTLNAQVLGGNLSLFQSVCVLGYCVFPLTIATFVIWIPTAFFSGLHIAIKLPIVLICLAWSIFASYGFLASSVPLSRKGLATYPVALFYIDRVILYSFETR